MLYNLLIEVNDNSTWPDGSKGLLSAIDGPLDDANNRLILNIMISQLWPIAVYALKLTKVEESGV